jgi:hypothetical protein
MPDSNIYPAASRMLTLPHTNSVQGMLDNHGRFVMNRTSHGPANAERVIRDESMAAGGLSESLLANGRSFGPVQRIGAAQTVVSAAERQPWRPYRQPARRTDKSQLAVPLLMYV